ncbi:hypothetical protein [Lactococcus formosensis]|uniref:hypothetical protein n=1 Tax=Lactococcus formosensis TaxID=1281486 RepID=UPI001BD0C754|nr:hypothetical protein [Lactococcus formosensis]
MNYQELADRLNRPYNTIRKWRGEIEKISGYHFNRIKVRNGRGRKNRTTYDFSKDDLQDFLALEKLLLDGKSKEYAISEIWGNLAEEERSKQDDRLSRLTRNFNIAKGKIKTLEDRNQVLQSDVATLHNQVMALTKRVEALENKGLKNIFKKQ